MKLSEGLHLRQPFIRLSKHVDMNFNLDTPFLKSSKLEMNFDLDTTLIKFSDSDRWSHFTIRNAVEGVQIFGGIGSSKTSGSGRLLALKYLSNRFGGLVLTAKADER